MKEERQILTNFHEKIITAIIEKYSKIMKKSFSKIKPFDGTFEYLEELLIQRIDLYFTSNNRTYQVTPESLKNIPEIEEVLNILEDLNEDLLDYDNLISK